jgi:hypothetical protein
VSDYIWELRKGEALLGILTLKDQDMFWFSCDFSATPEFEPYRNLFAQEAQLLDTAEDETRFEALYAEIGALNLSLHINDKFDDENAILLHILENTAWFRPLNAPWMGGWVDNPFDEDG